MPKTFILLLLCAIAASLLLPFSVLAALILLVAVTLLSPAAKQWRPGTGLDGVLLAWLIWLPASLYWSLSIGLAMQWAGTLLLLPLSYLAWRQLATLPWAERALHLLLSGLLLLLAVWGILQGPETLSAKPQGPFNDANTFAGVLSLLALPLLAHYLAADLNMAPAWRRTAQLALLGAGALTFFLIASRGATLSIMLVLLPLLWLARTQSRFSRKLLLLACVAGMAYLSTLWVTSGLGNVLLRLVGTLQEGDSSRVMLVRSTLQMIADHPWLGTGLGSFRLLYPRYRMHMEAGSGGGWVHNDYLQLWQEGGLPMLLLVSALVIWVVRELWRSGRRGEVDRATLIRLGYLFGMLAVFIQAGTNFMFYFAFVSLFLGIYLARAQPVVHDGRVLPPMPRAWRMAVTGYGAILALLFGGHVVVDSLLDRTSWTNSALVRWGPVTSRYEVARWSSVLAPFHHSPPQVMGQEMVNMIATLQGAPAMKAEMMAEALESMETSQRLAPCYVPYGTEALDMLVRYGQGAANISQGHLQVAKNLACNPHHGATFYYAGVLKEKAGDMAGALKAWQSGLPKTIFFADRLILVTAILSRTTSGHEASLGELASKMVAIAHHMETHPNSPLDGEFWLQSQYQLIAANQAGFLKLTSKSIR
jgi:O-antigen ligase